MWKDDKMYEPLEKFIGTTLSEKQKANIRAREKNGMYLYNYGNVVIVPRNDPVIMKCRGLVLDKNGGVLNYPFDRFFNPHEKEATKLDWDTAVVQEKFDGSLICVFWYDGGWEVTTRGSFYPQPLADFDFADKFRELFTGFDQLSKTHCYMFEMCTEMNRIVTWYNMEFISLIGIRNLETLEEYPSQHIQHVALSLNVKSPKIYDVKDLASCMKMFESFPDDEEGFVVIDANFNRLKIKQDTYLALSKIKLLKVDELLDYVRGKLELDGELLSKDEKTAEKIDEVRKEWENMKDFIDGTFHELNKLETRKEFALASLKFPFNKFLFAMKDSRQLRTIRLTYDELIRWRDSLP